MEHFNANHPNGNGRKGMDKGPKKVDTFSAQSVLDIGGDGITAAEDLSWQSLRRVTWRARERDNMTQANSNKER